MVGERLRGSGGGLDLALNPPARPHRGSTESVNRVLKSVSKQSLLSKYSIFTGSYHKSA